jgi:hypothetical protein
MGPPTIDRFDAIAMLSDDGSPFPSSGVEMRLPALLVFLASSLLFSGRVSAAGAEALPELQAAQRAAWQTVAILAHGLTGRSSGGHLRLDLRSPDPHRHPGDPGWNLRRMPQQPSPEPQA